MRGEPIPPVLSDHELERLLIAQLFHSERAIDHIGALEAEDFTDPNLGAILMACADVHSRGGRITPVNMITRLRGIMTLDGEDGLAIIQKLTVGDNAPRVDEVARRLRDLAERRRASDYLRSAADAMNDESLSLEALAQDAQKHLETLSSPEISGTEDAPHLHTLAKDFVAYLQSEEPPVEITTGLRDLDEATGGWHRGQFIILAGRPSMGKTTVALSSLLRTARAGHGVLFFSLEMAANQIAARALTDIAYTDPPIAYADLKPRRSDHFIARLSAAAERFEGLPLEIETKPGPTADQIFSRAKSAAAPFEKVGKRLDLVVIDHLLKVSPSGRYAGNPVKELDEVSLAMCDMAKRLNVAVVGLHQLNRDNEDRENQRAMLPDLRGSGSLEQDADVVLFCYRPAYRIERLVTDDEAEREANEALLSVVRYDLELQIAKQRNGPTSNINLWCDVKSNAVRNKEWRR
jgi:replicative DNA helicase